MDPIAIALAFVLGFAARQVGLPPLVGYLIAGFVLWGLGVEAGPAIEAIADLGVTLLLFTIGLKLKIKTLLRAEVWAGASIHMVITTAAFGAGFASLAALGLVIFAELDLVTATLVAFALSFSSTVFAVKVLEDKGEMNALHGRTTIGILIMQDLFAVVFLSLSTGELPSPWALALFGLILARPLLGRMMDHCGHGELLPLFGLFAALALGAATFELVGIKADLGALLLGALLAPHKKSAEVADSLLAVKDVLLIAFFLAIGLSGVPTPQGLAIALLLVLLVPLKVALFFYLLTRFHMRARSSLLAALSLANYSEFGLIVGAVAVRNGWLSSEWLVIIAIALALSFVIASPVNVRAHELYARFHAPLRGLETPTRHPDEQPISPGAAWILIFGMGRIGTGAYDYLRERFGERVLGIDNDADKVAAHRQAGRNVLLGDATDSDFWERADQSARQIRLVMLAMPEHRANRYAAEQIAARGYAGRVAALAFFPDQAAALEALGVHSAYNAFAEAGAGFAAHVYREFGTALGAEQTSGHNAQTDAPFQ